jgi:hypothetical protein
LETRATNVGKGETYFGMPDTRRINWTLERVKRRVLVSAHTSIYIKGGLVNVYTVKELRRPIELPEYFLKYF